MVGRTENQDYPADSITENGQNTKMSVTVLNRLVVT